jgi:hypothetical protein
MNALITLSILAILVLYLGLYKAKNALLPVSMIGLASGLILALLEWNSGATPIYSGMMQFDNFAVAFTAIGIVSTMLILLISKDYFERISENGIILNTASISGYCLLYFVARLKPIRPRSLRFNLEQERIETWLAKIAEIAPINYELACEIAECANVIKGYGETHRNGWRNFTSIMVEVDKVSKNSDAASRIKELRLAALADEDGTKLRNYLNA